MSDINPEGVDPKVIDAYIRQGIPHCGATGMRLVRMAAEDTVMALPYNPDLVGDPTTGVLHGGAVTALIDTVCGMAVLAGTRKLQAIATLDLRIDYLKPARAQAELLAAAHCYKITRTIAFVRARAYHEDAPDDLIASCVATFMLGSSDKPAVSLRRKEKPA
ncbi:PaaI family thioesterase [Ferrovibrio sp. MS7]|jgi:uncharacterized protein (TIGR00369 family)|uniref:PaaI family thioesterase n=1 Tax=Ferrovibrio plantarum TaxID=3119164 RepID=UPI001B429981|nr:PaaI family thioesterase [Ferrovibrio sp.]